MSFETTDFDERLQNAVDSFDRDGVADLCGQLILSARERDDVYPAEHARILLGLLRGKRYFDLMQQVADTLIQHGQTDPGSSGSPVLNDQWDLIGLHHTGAHYMPRLHGQDGTYPANEGIRVKAIIAALEHSELG